MAKTEPENDIHGEPIPEARFGSYKPGSSDEQPANDESLVQKAVQKAPSGIVVGSDGRTAGLEKNVSMGNRLSRSGIEDQESVGASAQSTQAQNEERALLGAGVAGGIIGGGMRTEGGKRTKRRWYLNNFTKRRMAIATISLLVGGGGFFAVGSILQGPAVILQFADKLEDSFSERKSEDSSRMMKVGRYAYHLQRGSGVQNVRLSYLSNKYADRIEARMNKSGFESAYKQKSGYREGYFIDPEKLADTDMSKYQKYDADGNLNRAATNDAIKAGLQNDFGLTAANQSDGRLFIDTTQLDNSYRKASAFDKYILKSVGYGDKISAINFRVVGQRAGVTWHPVKKIDRRINMAIESGYNTWREERRASVTGDTERAGGARSGVVDDPNTSPEQNEANRQAANAAAENGNAMVDEATQASSGDRSAVERFQSSTQAKVLASSAGAIGVACVIKAVDDSAASKKEAEVIMPLIKISADYIALASQIRSGIDITIEKVGYFARQLTGLDSSGKKTSYTESALYRKASNKEGGAEPNETIKAIPSGSPFAFINQGTLGAVTAASCSTAGMAATTIVSVATGGIVSTATGILASAIALPHVISQLGDWISGTPINPIPVGADLGTAGIVGSQLTARYQGVSGGGRELSPEETAFRQSIINDEAAKELQSKSFAYRMLSLDNSQSLASTLVASSATHLYSPTVGSILNPANTIKSTLTAFTKIGTSRTNAQSNSSARIFNDVGFSADELQHPAVRNPFQNGEDVIQRILPAHKDYIERAKTCYGVEINPATYDVVSLNAGTPTFEDATKDECKDKSIDFLQFRMYIKDSQLMTSLACYEGDAQACKDVGAEDDGGSSSNGTSSSDEAAADFDIKKLKDPSDNVDCAPNTKDAGVIDGYTNGQKVRIRLCEIPNLPQATGYGSKNGHATVNARVSGAVYAMVEAAKVDGVDMAASSSSRTMADQQSLCPCDGERVARPGFSNHQLGVAIDFGGNGILMNKSNPMWKWLNENADRFGYKPYTAEDWHWSPFGS